MCKVNCRLSCSVLLWVLHHFVKSSICFHLFLIVALAQSAWLLWNVLFVFIYVTWYFTAWLLLQWIVTLWRFLCVGFSFLFFMHFFLFKMCTQSSSCFPPIDWPVVSYCWPLPLPPCLCVCVCFVFSSRVLVVWALFSSVRVQRAFIFLSFGRGLCTGPCSNLTRTYFSTVFFINPSR